MTRPFRFGVVAPLRTDLPTWRDRVRRIADVGYSTLLMPDVPQLQPAPGPTLTLAAAVANIRVGTWASVSVAQDHQSGARSGRPEPSHACGDGRTRSEGPGASG